MFTSMCFISNRFPNYGNFFADKEEPWNLHFRVLVTEFVHDIMGKLTE